MSMDIEERSDLEVQGKTQWSPIPTQDRWGREYPVPFVHPNEDPDLMDIMVAAASEIDMFGAAGAQYKRFLQFQEHDPRQAEQFEPGFRSMQNLITAYQSIVGDYGDADPAFDAGPLLKDREKIFNEREQFELMEAKNRFEFEIIAQSILDRRRNLQTLALGGHMSTASIFGVALLSPINALPLARLNAVLKAKGLASGVYGALAVGGTIGLEEAAIMSQDPSRDMSEALINTALGAGLGYAFGRHFGRQTKYRPFEELINEDLRLQPRDRMKIKKPSTKTRVNDPIKPTAIGIERMLAHAIPNVRMTSSQSPALRSLVTRLLEIPFDLKGNKVLPRSVEERIKYNMKYANDFKDVLSRSYQRYLKDTPTLEATVVDQMRGNINTAIDHVRAGDFARLGQHPFTPRGKMTFDEYKSLVSRYTVNALDPDTMKNPPIGVAEASASANKLFKEWEPRAMAAFQGKQAFGSGVTTNFLTRYWDVEQIALNPAAAEDILVDQWVRHSGQYKFGQDLTEIRDMIRGGINRMINEPIERIDMASALGTTSRKGLDDRYWWFVDDSEIFQTKLVVDDIEAIVNNYAKTTMADIEFFEEFGTLNTKEIIKELRNEMKAEIALVKGKGHKLTSSELTRLDGDVEMLEALFDRVRGTYMHPWSATPGSTSKRVVDNLLKYNNLRLGGKFTISSFPDVARPVMHMGLARSYGPLFKRFMKKHRQLITQMDASSRELRAMNVGNELMYAARLESITNTGRSQVTRSKLTKALDAANSSFFMLNGLTPWNIFNKRLAGIGVVDRILHDASLHVAGTLPAKEMRFLQTMGLSKGDLRKLNSLFKKHGSSYEGVNLMNFGDWPTGTNKLRDNFSQAVGKEVDRIIVTPGVGDIPIIMSADFAKVLFQYKTFGIASTSRALIPLLQNFDQNATTGLLMAVLAGIASTQIKDHINGTSRDEDWITLLGRGIDASGVTGVLGETNNMLSMTPLSGLAITGYDPNPGINPAILGPTATGITDLSKVIQGSADGRMSEFEQRAFNRVAPYGSLYQVYSTLLPIGDNWDQDGEIAKQVSDHYSGSRRGK
jgi:hypothetical protein